MLVRVPAALHLISHTSKRITHCGIGLVSLGGGTNHTPTQPRIRQSTICQAMRVAVVSSPAFREPWAAPKSLSFRRTCPTEWHACQLTTAMPATSEPAEQRALVAALRLRRVVNASASLDQARCRRARQTAADATPNAKVAEASSEPAPNMIPGFRMHSDACTPNPRRPHADCSLSKETSGARPYCDVSCRVRVTETRVRDAVESLDGRIRAS